MSEIGLFFGSDDGNTQSISARIAKRFGEENVDLHDVAEITQLDFARYEKLIMAIPTWDFGQAQTDWDDFWPELEQIDFGGKTMAFVGLGDQFGYSDFFLDAMGQLHDEVAKTAARIIGYWPTAGYEFDASRAKIAGENMFVGLALDQDQQPQLTCNRLNQWCRQVHAEFGLKTPLQLIQD